MAAALLVGAVASAQRLSVATNVLDYADFGTLNVEGDVAVARASNCTPPGCDSGPGTCSRAGGSGERSNTRNTTGEGSARL